MAGTMTFWSMLEITCLMPLPALLINIDRPDEVRPAPGVCSPVMYRGIIVSSSARALNFSNTAISSLALLLGWKNVSGGELSL